MRLARVLVVTVVTMCTVVEVATAAPSPAQLARRISTATTITEATAATREVLRLARAPVLDQASVANLALDARSRAARGSVTLTDLAQLLRRAGVPARHGASPKLLRRLLAGLARGARSHPRSRYAFGPRFLAAMAQRRRPQTGLTLLEVQVLAATLLQPAGGAKPQEPQDTTPAPCSALKKQLSEMLPGAGDVLEKSVSTPGWLKVVIEHFSGKPVGNSFEILAKGMDWAFKAATVLSFYLAAAPTVSAEPAELSKPEPGGPQQQVEITVNVGMSDSEVEAWQGESGSTSAFFDCIRALGIDLPKNNPEVLRDIADWRVDLRVTGPPGVLQLARGEYPVEDGRATVLTYPLTPRGRYQGEVRVRYDVLEETASEHNGSERIANMTATAEVKAGDAPSLLDFVERLGALPGFVFGWIKSAVPPSDTAPIGVTYGHDGRCGEVRGDAVAALDGFRTGRYVGKGRTPGDPDPEQERPGAECEEFSIEFTAELETIKQFSITSLDWVCVAREQGDKRSPPALLELPYTPHPDGFQRRVIDHRRGRFSVSRQWRGSSPIGPIDAVFEMTGRISNGKAHGTLLYSEAFRALSGFPAKCSTGNVRWSATRRP